MPGECAHGARRDAASAGEVTGTHRRPVRLWERIGDSRVLVPLIYAGGIAWTLQVANAEHGDPAAVGWLLEGAKVTVLAVWSWVVFGLWLRGRREGRAWRRQTDR